MHLLALGSGQVMVSQTLLRSQAIWYTVWSALLAICAGNTLFAQPVLGGNCGLAFSMLAAVLAASQIAAGVTWIDRRQAGMATVVLGLFSVEQVRQWVTTLELPRLYRDFDFSAYYLAAKAVSGATHPNLYDLPLYADGRMNLHASAPLSQGWQAAATHYHVAFAAPYIYPPFFAALMQPLSHLSFYSAATVWEGVGVLLLAGSAVLSLNLGGVCLRPSLALMASVGLLSFYPVAEGLFQGQVDCLILFLLTASVWLLTRNHTWLSALTFAAATLVKLTPVLAVPVLLMHRRWKWLFAYVLWMSCLLMISVHQAGWAMHLRYWHFVLPRIACGSPVAQNASLVAYVQELFLRRVPGASPQSLPPYACLVSRMVALAAYCVLLAAFYRRRGQRAIARDLVIMVLIELALSPVTWWHHYTIALLPFLYLWSRMPGNRVLLILFVIVGTNVVGYLLLFAENPITQLMLAAIVPGLTLVLAYRAIRC